MNLKEYKHLIKCRFLDSSFGCVVGYWSRERREIFHKYEDISDMLMKQMTCDFDVNNIIILFPNHGGFGSVCLFDNGTIAIDHPSYIIDVTEYLKEYGIKWKDGTEICYSKDDWCVDAGGIIIEDGLARTIETNNILGNLRYFKNPKRHKEIKWNEEDQKNIDIGNKEIFFSGFFVERHRRLKNKKI